MPTPIITRRVLANRPAWQPRDLPGLRLWLEADQITDLASTDPVSTWSDRSGYGNHATQAGGARPTFVTGSFGTLPGVRFTSASSQYLLCDGLLPLFQGSDPAHTIIMVVKPLSVATTMFYVGAGSSISSGTDFHFYGNNATGSYRHQRVDATTPTTNHLIAGASAAAHVFTYIFTGTTLTVRVDGVTGLDAVAFDVGAVSCDHVALGAVPRDTVTGFVDGPMGAMFASNLALPLPYVIQAEWYCRKYGAVVA